MPDPVEFTKRVHGCYSTAGLTGSAIAFRIAGSGISWIKNISLSLNLHFDLGDC